MRFPFAPLRAFTFSNPVRNKIVILYSDDYWIRTLLLQELAATTLDVYPGRLYLTPVLVWRTLLRLWRLKWREAASRPVLKELVRQAYTQYVLACIDQTEAKVVLTAIDNSGFFQRLSRLDPARTYFAIQNGTRTLACVRDSLPPPPHPASIISMTNLFCFGQRDVDLYAKYAHKVDRCVPVGSLVSGYYNSRIANAAITPQFDLCLISQWHEQFFLEISGDDFPARVARRIGAGISRLMAFLVRLLRETDLTLVICPRSERNGRELAFYRDHFSERAFMAESDRRNFSTYRVIEQSRLAIALNSTMLAEVFAWGHKVLWCNVPDDEHYEMPEAGICYFHGNDYGEFKNRVLTLLEMPQAEFERRTREGARYINNYDPANPPHAIIRAAVLDALTRSHS